MPVITVRDQTTAGQITNDLTVDLLTEEMTVRELIRSRIYEEVQDYNRKQPKLFRGLVQPTDTEATLNGYKLKAPRQIDWKPQFEKACEAFESNRILILIDGRQVNNLDQQVTLPAGAEVYFLRLVPLVGG